MSFKKYWTSINWNKVVVIFGLNWVALSTGFTNGQMTGLISALQKKDEGISLNEAQISLIAASTNLCYLISLAYLAILSNRLGRRWCYIICSIPLVVNWVILYYATNFTEFLISRFLAGISVCPLIFLNVSVIAEFCTYKYRGVYISILTVLTVTFGVGLGHIAGILLHWRSSSLLGLGISLLHVFLPYFWVESPHWLAMKGRIEECETAFRKLHGNDIENEHELNLLVKMETTKQKAAKELKSNSVYAKLLLDFKKKYFWDLMIMSTIIYIYYAVAGKVIFSNLATVILEDITGSPDVLLCTVLIDVFIFIGSFISCIFIKKTSVRYTLFTSGLISIGILLLLSLFLYLKNNEVYIRWIRVSLLCLYFIIIHAGPYPVMEILLGEMYPIDLKFYFLLLISPVIMITLFLTILLMPFTVSIVGYHGLFLTYSIIMCICLGYLYLKLPETKGKTLQEIEVFMKTKKFDVEQVLNSEEQIKSLI